MKPQETPVNKGVCIDGNIVAWHASMNVSMYQAAAAMNAHARWQEVVSGNLAASAVPGFKRDEVSFASIEAGMMEAESSTGPLPFEMPKPSLGINFEPGEFRFTGNNLDVAIETKGFFEVEMPDGQLAYTRDGQFGLNSQGQVVTKDGYLVMGDGGPIQVDLNIGRDLQFSSTGDASQGGQARGRLRVVDFNDPQLLQRNGGYFLANDPALQLQQVEEPQLRPNSLEAANVSPMMAMTSLLTSMRLFEANSHLLQMQDQHLERAVRDLTPNT